MVEKRKETVLRGIGVSPGVVVGPVFVLSSKSTKVPEWNISAAAVHKEVSRFEEALIETRVEAIVTAKVGAIVQDTVAQTVMMARIMVTKIALTSNCSKNGNLKT